MSKTSMAGAFLKDASPAFGTRSHSSESDRPSITRRGARTQTAFVRLAHKQDRAHGRAQVTAEVDEWLASLNGDQLVEAATLVDEPEPVWPVGYIARDGFDFEDNLDFEELTIGAVAPWPGAPEASDPWEGQAEQAYALGWATSMTLEEANEAGLRVTNRPSGYTYGRS